MKCNAPITARARAMRVAERSALYSFFLKILMPSVSSMPKKKTRTRAASPENIHRRQRKNRNHST